MTRSARQPDCGQVRDDLSEFALGTLAGRDRSRVLDHVTTCAACRAELETLSLAADALLNLAPASEPPVGFEVRLMQRLRAETPRRATRHRRRDAMLVAAALALLIAGFSIGRAPWRHASTTAIGVNAAPRSAELTSHGRVVGHVWLSPGPAPWIYMTLDQGHWSGTAWCEVTLATGRALAVGTFSLKNGYGAWAAPINGAQAAVASARVTGANDVVLASANLTTPAPLAAH